MTDSPVADADVNGGAPIGRARGAPRPDDADWNSPEDASYDQHQEQQ